MAHMWRRQGCHWGYLSTIFHPLYGRFPVVTCSFPPFIPLPPSAVRLDSDQQEVTVRSLSRAAVGRRWSYGYRSIHVSPSHNGSAPAIRWHNEPNRHLWQEGRRSDELWWLHIWAEIHSCRKLTHVHVKYNILCVLMSTFFRLFVASVLYAHDFPCRDVHCIPYSWKYWRGIKFGGFADLGSHRQF